MSDFLERVVAERRAYVAAARAARPLAEVERAAERAAVGRGRLSFSDAIRRRRSEGRLAVIAEVKRVSPALGPLAPKADPARLVDMYRRGGAVAISVLVEPHHWGGSLDDLRAVEEATRRFSVPAHEVEAHAPEILPVLAKDVVVDVYQVAEAGASGAQAVLLIAEIFTDAELRRLVDYARGIGMESLVEAHERHAFRRALRCDAPAIGVNARDLRHPATLDRQRIHELAREVVTDQVLVAESGIASVTDAERLPPRVDAILVGTALVTSNAPEALVAALAGVRPGRVLA